MLIRVPVIIFVSIVAVATTPFAPAEAQGAAARPAKSGPPPIPRAAFIANMEAEFRTIDSDRNNVLTVAEIETSQRVVAAKRMSNQANALFVQLDTDKNGQLSPAEFAHIPLPSSKPNASPMLSRFDANKDKAISLIEYRGGTLMNFDRLDTDKDGVVSPAEMHSVGIGR